MKKLCARLRAACARPAGRWLASGALTLLLFALVFALLKPGYLNVDDSNIAKALSGALSGTPEPHPFINCLLGKALCFLYGLLPRVAWWPLSEYAMLFFASVALCASLLKYAERRGLSLFWPLALYALYAWTLLSCALLWLSFTLTSAALGAASVATLMAARFDSFETERRTRPLSLLLSVSLLALAFLYRNSAGLSILPFWLLALCYKLLRLRTSGKGSWTAYRRALCCGLAAAAVACALQAVNAWGLEHDNEAGFVAFDTARSDYIDYPVDAFSDNPALYEAEGWDAPLAALVKNWFLMDERVTAEALSRISAGSEAQSRTLARRVADALSAGEALARGNGVMQYTLTLPAALLCCCLAAFLHGDGAARRRRWPGLVSAFLCAGGAFIMCFYLCYRGRFLLRTYLLLAFPATACLAMLLLGLLPAARAEGRKRAGQRAAMTVLIGLLCAPLAWGLAKTGGVLFSYDPSASFAESRALYAYASARPDNLYIRDTAAGQDIEPFFPYADALPQNVISWGDTDMRTAARAAHMRALGLASFTPELFLQSNVYYVTSARSENAAVFAAYLAGRFGASLVKADEPGHGLIVYRVEAAKG